MDPSNMKSLRLENNLRQEDIASKLNITRQAYGLWETGDRTPDIDSLIFLAKFYNVSLDFLVGLTSLKNDYSKDKKLEAYLNSCIEVYKKHVKTD